MGLVIHPACVGNAVMEKMAEESFRVALVDYESVVEILMEEYLKNMGSIAYDQGHSKAAISVMDEKELKSITRTTRRKMAREAAREWLPNMTETKIVTTMNVRAWRHFFNMRGAPAADRQIRRCAVLIFSVIQPQAPWCFQDIHREDTEDGIGCLVSENPKV
jgi:thymidylate synthase ThyX